METNRKSNICNKVHPYIKSGECPRCVAKVSSARPVDKAAASVEWDVQGLVEVLRSLDERPDDAGMLISALAAADEQLCRLLVPFRQALLHPHPLVQEVTGSILFVYGRKLSMVTDFLKRIELEPHLELPIRIILRGYFGKLAQEIPEAAHNYNAQILWFIEHCPRWHLQSLRGCHIDAKKYPTDYEKGKTLWMLALERYPEDRIVVEQVALYVEETDPDMAERLMTNLRVLYPEDAEIVYWLSEISKRRFFRDPSHDPVYARRAIEWYTHLFRMNENDHEEQWRIYSQTMMLRLELGELDLARSMAEEILSFCQQESHFFYRSSYMHRCFVALGRIALRQNEVLKSRNFLLQSVDFPEFRPEHYSRPDMRLAQELLLRSERDVVMDFISRCMVVWPDPNHRGEQWLDAIREGRVPDFNNHDFCSCS